jgi:hypothetical protein
MKKIVILFVIVSLALISCKKDTQQPSWWQRLWHKEYVIFEDLESKHKDVIIPKIESSRTSIAKYIIWDKDTIQINGPAGYRRLADKGFAVWNASYRKQIFPNGNINELPLNGQWAEIITAYLTLRREEDADDAFRKLWLYIPKELYKQDSRFWEMWFTAVSGYFTTYLGGDSQWSNGTRSLEQEIYILNLPYAPETESCTGEWDCTAQGRITTGYLEFAETGERATIISPEVDTRQQEALMRYDIYQLAKSAGKQLADISTEECLTVEKEGNVGILIPVIKIKK